MDLKTITAAVEAQRRVSKQRQFRSDLTPQLSDAITAIANDDLDREGKNLEISRQVVIYLLQNGRFFKTANGKWSDAIYLDRTYHYYYSINSDDFLSRIAQLTGIGRATKLFEYVKCAIEDAAVGRNVPTIVKRAFWYVGQEATYITYKMGSVLRIDKNGPRIVDNGTDDIIFPSNNYLASWDLQSSFSDPFDTLTAFKRATYDNSWSKILLKLWTLAMFCMRTDGSKPLLMISGDGRCGKTVIADSIIWMLGIPTSPESVTNRSKDEEIFWLKLDRGGIVALDNVDSKVDWLCNALCCASSKDSHSRRALYTDKEEINFSANSWVITTSVNPAFADNTSLTDRMVIVRLGYRDNAVFSSHKSALEDEAKKYQSHVLSWIVDQVARYYRTPHESCDVFKRDPQFSSMAMTFGKIWGKEQAVMTALTEGETLKLDFALRNSKVGALLVMLARRWAAQPFEGDAQLLLATFKEIDPTFNLMSLKEFIGEMKNLTPAISRHIVYSAGGNKDNPWYKIGGLKGENYIMNIPTMDEITTKTTSDLVEPRLF